MRSRTVHRVRAGGTLFLLAMCAGAGGIACSDDSVAGSGGASSTGSGAMGAGASGGGGATSGGAGGAGGGLGGSAGPETGPNMFEHATGDADEGREVFRFETFGNEGFWTRVVQLPQGMKAAAVTPLMALAEGLSVDADRIPEAMKDALVAELATDLSPAQAPLLNDPATTEALVEANAVIGFSARNVTALNGTIDIDPDDVYAGESVGATCALCHGITDGSVYKPQGKGGSIGKRVDGPTNHDLQFGRILSLGLASRAYYPTLALDLQANMGMSLSRKGPGVGLISAAATEVEVDAYLTDSELYPIGMFDDATDGNGAPMHITPMFRADLAAPWGSEGSIEMLENFSNLVYTVLLDPTDLTTAGGRQFMMDRGGAAGIEVVDNYLAILASLGVPPGGTNGYPFVGSQAEVQVGLQAGAKVEMSPIGLRVDETKLLDMNAYLNSLPAPAGEATDPEARARGRLVFRTECTGCHRDDQSLFVPQNISPYNPSVELFANAPPRPDLYPAWMGTTLADRTAAGLAPVRDFAGTFDDKLVVVDASNRDQPRGSAMPLLLDLARKPVFLHDNSVSSLEELLDPTQRAADAPHPFFLADAAERADVIVFLRGLDDQPLP
ncbi:MAG: hypothetical protein WKG00_19345 [Polyangiaceae bacterium]